MKVSELLNGIIKMVEEDKIKMSDNVEIEVEYDLDRNVIGNVRNLLVSIDIFGKSSLVIKS